MLQVAGDDDMHLAAATPIALYGFIMAATWIDFIAGHLVSLLEFLGVVSVTFLGALWV